MKADTAPLRQAFLFQLAQRRRAMGKGNRVRTKHPRAPKSIYPWAIEVSYAQSIAKLLKPLIDYTEDYLKKHAEELLRGDHRDQLTGPGFKTLWSDLNGWVGQYWPDDPDKAPTHVMMGINGTAEKTASFGAAQWAKQTTSILGVSFTDSVGPWWPEIKKQWAQKNYKLISSLSDDYIDKVNFLTEKAIKNGWTAKSLMEEIEGTGANITGARARLIARDQMGKLNASITQAQHQEIGMDTYIWSTSLDERVRPTHKALEGKTCSWDDASQVSDDGGKTWRDKTDDEEEEQVGEAIACRCTGCSDWSGFINEADASIDGEDEE